MNTNVNNKLNNLELDKIRAWYNLNFPNATDVDKRALEETLAEVPGSYFEFIDRVILSDDNTKNRLTSAHPEAKNPTKFSFHFNGDINRETDLTNEGEIQRLLKDGPYGLNEIFLRIRENGIELADANRADGYRNAFAIKSEPISSTWQEKFTNWYDEYTKGSPNRGLINNIKSMVNSLPDEYCQFFDEFAMETDGAPADLDGVLKLRKPVAFNENLKRATVGRDPKGMESVLLDLLNGDAVVENPDAALDYFNQTHLFEMEFLKDAIDPAAHIRETEAQKQAENERFNSTLEMIEVCQTLQQAIIDDIDAMHPQYRADKIRDLEEQRRLDHINIQNDLRFHNGISKIFKSWSMRWDAYQRRKEQLKLFDEREAINRKLEVEKLAEIKNLHKQLKEQGVGTEITDEFREGLVQHQNNLRKLIYLRNISVEVTEHEETQDVEREETQEAPRTDARVSMADRLAEHVTSTTVQTRDTEISDSLENTKETPNDPEIENE